MSFFFECQEHSQASSQRISGTAFLPPSSQYATGWVSVTPQTLSDQAGTRQKVSKEPKPQKTVNTK